MKSTFAALVAFSLLMSCSKKESNTIMYLTGNVKGLKKGTLYIQKLLDTTVVTIDTIVINGDANFSSNLEIKSPEMYYLFLDRGTSNSLDNKVAFFAEAGTIHIETSLDYFLSDTKITGSKNQERYEMFKKITSRFNDENLTLMELKFKAFKDKNPAKMDSIEKIQTNAKKRRYLYTANFAVTNKDFEVAPYVVLSEIPNVNLKLLDTIQRSMSQKVAQSTYGKKLVKLFQERKRTETIPSNSEMTSK